jgi:hypothetical protein
VFYLLRLTTSKSVAIFAKNMSIKIVDLGH